MKWIVILGLVFVSACTFAEDIGEIVVTAGRYEEPKSEVGSSVDVVYSEDIEEKGSSTVLEMLRTIPGLNVSQNGGLGGLTSIFIRGSGDHHALVMIDGVEMNDPISGNRSFDWAHLLADNIERIEIVRGPQSTLYGSDAMGGVINIITKKGKGKPVTNIVLEGGSYYTYRESAYSSGAFTKGDYSVSLTHINSSGFSRASGGSENDGYDNTTFTGNINVDLFPKAKWNLTWRYLDAKSDIDNGGFLDDPNYTTDSVVYSGKTGLEHSIKDWWKYDLVFSWMDSWRDYSNPVDELSPSSDLKAWFDGLTLKGDWQNTIEIGDVSTLVGGVEYQEERGESYSKIGSVLGDFISEFSKKTADTIGLYVQDTIRLWERLVVTAGGRYEDHENFSDRLDYKIWASYLLPKLETRLKGSFGTGFKAPTLFQLFSVYGSPGLDPEEVESYDIGFSQPLFNDRVHAGVTYFHNDFSDLINFDFLTSKFQNISSVETSGIETEISLFLSSKLNTGLTYTYLETEDETTGKELLRRPMHTYGLNVSWYPTEKYTIRMDLTYVGERRDTDFRSFPFKDVTLDGYTKVDLSMHYKIHPSCELFGRVENLLDSEYEEVLGFQTARISGYGGLKVEF